MPHCSKGSGLGPSALDRPLMGDDEGCFRALGPLLRFVRIAIRYCPGCSRQPRRWTIFVFIITNKYYDNAKPSATEGMCCFRRCCRSSQIGLRTSPFRDKSTSRVRVSGLRPSTGPTRATTGVFPEVSNHRSYDNASPSSAEGISSESAPSAA